ncbi:hypothetical protein LVB87_13515 [Lysobacter sp. KIS68-7]|uniref:hypothetical protein n=1 Tax=Lysobacter sp. KIS68-7 TaxID=2904252 RepID=UPI001E5DDEA7|nr:hypothetical protein [Lysobacter sp. KIS68-7]UHQ19190.1 hypothetical protein LVB87_13515 [Lysobacter sp. KIS68-7]
MKKPPFPLAAVAIAYLGLEIWLLARGAEAAVWVRFALSLWLVVFLLRGSRIAGGIWLVCNLLSALYTAVATFRVIQTDVTAAGLFAVLTAAILAHCVYLFFSPAVRRFQSPARSH